MATGGTHILIVGAGAVGAFYGARLHNAKSGVHVSVVARSNRAAVVAKGFYIESQFYGNSTWMPHRVFASCADAAVSGIRFAYVIVATKSLPDVRDDSVDLEPLMVVQTEMSTILQQQHKQKHQHKQYANVPSIVLIQNGFGIEWSYRARFPDAPILSCVTAVSSQQTAPGVIRHNRWSRITIGPFFIDARNTAKWTIDPANSGRVRDAQCRIDTIVSLLQAGGIADAESVNATEIQLVRWHKLAINAAFSPSAILSGGLGSWQMANEPELLEHIRGCMTEIFDAAPRVLGAPLPPHLASPDAIIKSTLRNVGSKPSMLVDWEMHRPIEIQVILGNPIRLARKCGVSMHRLQTMYALLNSAGKQRQLAASTEKSKI